MSEGFEGFIVVFAVVVMFVLGAFVGEVSGKRSKTHQWCHARFAQAYTAADSLAVVRDTLPRGCKIESR